MTTYAPTFRAPRGKGPRTRRQAMAIRRNQTGRTFAYELARDERRSENALRLLEVHVVERLEVRIGELLGPAPGKGARTDIPRGGGAPRQDGPWKEGVNWDPNPTCHRDDKLHRQQEADFRQMAAHPEVVERP